MAISATDAAGYLTGESKATDYCIQLIASRSYLEKWRYGATLKFANSNLIDKKASALLADIGVMYADTNSQWYIGATIKNAGITIKNYETGNNQPLPMDLQIGITKNLRKPLFPYRLWPIIYIPGIFVMIIRPMLAIISCCLPIPPLKQKPILPINSSGILFLPLQ
ncbi:MAG: hypothetical protein IPI46_06905 [Bacteroidetes bacterium]|nr:hypothetical protein [Bacteroidota bacterium]